MYEQISEVPIEKDAFAKKLLALAGEYDITDFIFSGFNRADSTGSTIAQVENGVIFVTILYSMMMQFPEVFKLYLGVLIEMATSGGDFASAVGRKGEVVEVDSSINMDDFIAKQQP